MTLTARPQWSGAVPQGHQAAPPHLADAATTRMVTAFLTLILSVTLRSSQMTLERKGLAKLAPACLACGLGEQRDCPCVSPCTEVMARQGETLFQKPDLVEKLALTLSVSRAKLWALVRSRYQSQVSKLGPEPSPLA